MPSARPILVLALLSFATGCASAEVAPAGVVVRTTSAELTAPVKRDAGPVDLTRDGELAGHEHKVSMLEGRITAKLRAVETPKVETHASPNKGILYTTIHANLGDGQTVHCTAFDEELWPASLAAADLRGEHDWSGDGSETADKAAKTRTTLLGVDVSIVGGRPVLAARANAESEGGAVAADRKVIVTTTGAFTVACSDRTVGFSKRFRSFSNELLASIKLDPPPRPAPKRVVVYEMQVEGKTVGYYQLATYADGKGGTKTYGTESSLQGGTGRIRGNDAATFAAASARAEESEVRFVAVADNESTVDVRAERDAKGWNIRSVVGRAEVAKRAPRAPMTSVMMPTWTSRVQAAASAKRSSPVKIPLLAASGKPAVAVAQRQADGSVRYGEPGDETRATLDADGIATWSSAGARYDRIFAVGTR